jgi:Zn-dependent peptidase ImmA (M78 family)
VALGHERQDLSYEQAEREADRFAAALLAPPPVLRQLGVTDAEGIAGLCGISFQAARIAAKRLRGNLPAAPPELLKLYIPG